MKMIERIDATEKILIAFFMHLQIILGNLEKWEKLQKDERYLFY